MRRQRRVAQTEHAKDKVEHAAGRHQFALQKDTAQEWSEETLNDGFREAIDFVGMNASPDTIGCFEDPARNAGFVEPAGATEACQASADNQHVRIRQDDASRIFPNRPSR